MERKQYILAHDLGTSGNKASLFSVDGALVGSRVFSYDVHYSHGTWAEQDAEDYWRAVCETSRDLIRTSGIDAGEIKAVSFSGQMMGCLCVDRDGNALRPSIIWADQRAAAQAAAIEEKISPWDFYQITGHRNTASYGVQKLMWIRDHEPEIYEQTYKVLNAKDYIIHKLTGNFYTDYSDANSMECFDINRLCWSEQLIAYAGIDGDKLPEAKPSTFIAGTVTSEAAMLTGLAVGTPVVMGAGDGVTASVGAGSVEPGKTYSCMGTSAWITTAAEKPLYDPQMRSVTWVHAVPGLYAPNGTMQTAGGAYSWLKNTLCRWEGEQAERRGISPYDLINEEIAQSIPGAHGVLFLPYLLGERAPRWDAQASGSFLGLRPSSSRADMLRSVLEGVTLNLSVILDILRTQVDIREITVVGGGAKGEIWRQIMADVYDTRILVPSVLEEAGAMGAAVIAGVGAGLYKDFGAIQRFMDIAAVQEPDPEAVRAYEPVKKRFDACYEALKTVYPSINEGIQ